jgi:thymidine phosphorylase
VGELAGLLGAGRQRQGEAVDPAVGLEVLVRTGDRLEEDEVAVRIHARSEADVERVVRELPEVLHVGPESKGTVPLVQASIGLPTD